MFNLLYLATHIFNPNLDLNSDTSFHGLGNLHSSIEVGEMPNLELDTWFLLKRKETKLSVLDYFGWCSTVLISVFSALLRLMLWTVLDRRHYTELHTVAIYRPAACS